jgi:NAD(P)-dependent dehydrogenase (short-subunit alcohol dehydrogenase family)
MRKIPPSDLDGDAGTIDPEGNLSAAQTAVKRGSPVISGGAALGQRAATPAPSNPAAAPAGASLLTDRALAVYSLRDSGSASIVDDSDSRIISEGDMNERTRGVVLITGASSGIGRACAIHLAQRGYHVIGTTRRSPTEIQTELREEIGEPELLDIIGLDVDVRETVDRAVNDIVDRAGRLDAVVNCAGFGIAGSVEDTTDDEALGILQTNLMGTLRVCRAVLPIMRRQRSGTIINLSSIGGRMGLPFQGLYSATKYAVEGLTEALRMEVRRFGVRAVLIEPGDFCTEFTDRRVRVRRSGENDSYAAAFGQSLSIVEHDERNGASPELVARLVERILRTRSPRVRYTAGAAFQRLAAGLKRILPSRLSEWGLMKYYRLR